MSVTTRDAARRRDDALAHEVDEPVRHDDRPTGLAVVEVRAHALRRERELDERPLPDTEAIYRQALARTVDRARERAASLEPDGTIERVVPVESAPFEPGTTPTLVVVGG